MKCRKSILALLLGMSMLAWGCSNSASGETNIESNQETENDSEQSKLDVIQPRAYGNIDGLNLEPGTTISIIGRGGTAEYWGAIKAGAKKAVDDINQALNYKGDDKVKLVYSAPQEENGVDEQVNILDEELARYPAAVGIAAVDTKACEVQFDLAAENNIPIVAFDTGTEYQDIAALVKTDDQDAAVMAANKLCDLIGDEGEIVMVVHDTTSMTAIEREAAFKETVESNHPNVKIVEVYHLDKLEEWGNVLSETLGEETEEEWSHTDVLNYMLDAHPEIKGIYSTSESTADVIEKTLGEREGTEELKIVSFDGGTSQLERLESGAFSGLIVQNPFGIGYATVVASARAILELGNEAVVDTGYTWVDESNRTEPAIINMMY